MSNFFGISLLFNDFIRIYCRKPIIFLNVVHRTVKIRHPLLKKINFTQLKIWREKFVRKKRRIRSFSSYFYVLFVRNFVWKERKRAKNKQTLHGNWCVFCNNVLKFYAHTMDSLGENEFCETNVKEGAKRTNDSLSFLFGYNYIKIEKNRFPVYFYKKIFGYWFFSCKNLTKILRKLSKISINYPSPSIG